MDAAALAPPGYRLDRLLGEGATGAVYAATSPSGGRVAVKLLRPEVAQDSALRARFAREARIASEIESAHLAPILELGDDWLVLPLYERSLADTLRERGRLDVDETVRLAAELARGLDALHERGIVHRDVKPSNVLLAADGTAALADFGLARGADSTRLTEDRQVIGTPHYVAPEVIEGAEATAASDVYGLGCLLYEALAGAPPFPGRSVAEVVFGHLVEPPPDPRDRRPELSADLATAVLAGLEKDPAARPPTATALARLLHVAGTPSRRRSSAG